MDVNPQKQHLFKSREVIVTMYVNAWKRAINFHQTTERNRSHWQL